MTQERARLVRLCTHLVGDLDAAEDLAQETLTLAWRKAENLHNQEAWQAWLSGIARNLCRRWHRSQMTSGSHTSLSIMAETADPLSLDTLLDRRELLEMLEQAMGLLPVSARQILLQRYSEETSVSEIAAKLGCSENLATVRLKRSKQGLHHLLLTRFREDAAAFGLVAEVDGPQWQETRLWCFRCGVRHLEGYMPSSQITPEAEGTSPLFALRCPVCDGNRHQIALSSQHQAMDSNQMIGGLKGFKPAFRHINSWWNARIEQGLRERSMPCWRCQGTMILRPITIIPPDGSVAFQHRAQFQCDRCDAGFQIPASGLAFHSPTGQQFWQEHSRMRSLPERSILFAGQPAIVARYEAVTSIASLEIVFAADTFQQLGTYSSP